MYSSSSSSFDPFHYSTISIDTHDHNPNPFFNFSSAPNFLHENPSLLLSDPPSLNIQQHQHNQEHPISGASALLTNQQEMNPTTIISSNKKTKAAAKRNDSSTKKQAPAPKRSGKKDRHSKIYTAHGPRDRRMRLSLQIARKFFDLQDMLGFDKASKTIDWLFSKSKSAIKEVTDNFSDASKLKRGDSGGGKSSVYSSSESEVMSGTDKVGDLGVTKEKRSSKKTEEKQGFSPLGKESRDMARARARERTKEKLKIKSKRPNPSMNLEQLGPDSCSVEDGKSLGLEEDEEEEEKEEKAGGITDKYLSHHYQMGSSNSTSSIIERYWGVTGETKSTSIFDLSHHENIAADFEDPFSGFPGNCIGRSVHHHHNNNIKLSTTTATGDVHNLENPNSMFMNNNNNNPAATSRKTTNNLPNFMIYQDHHHHDQNLANSLLMPPDHQEHNSSLFFMNLNTPLFPISNFTENHFSYCNPYLPIKYDDTL